MSSEIVKRCISIGALGFAILHLIWPSLGIDAVTIALLFVATLPWIDSILKGLAESGLRNLELPGGIKIELADVKSATDKVIRGAGAGVLPTLKGSGRVTTTPPTATAPSSIESFDYISEIANTDANLALVAFRIEIEKRLRVIAEANGLPTHRTSLNQLVKQLQSQAVFPTDMATGLMELIGLGNRAAHGVAVAQDAAAWVLDVAPSIVIELDTIANSSGA